MKEEFNLSRKIVQGAINRGEVGKYFMEEDVKEFIKKVIEEDLEMCKVCGGSHGSWLDKDDFVKKFKKRAGKELTTEDEK